MTAFTYPFFTDPTDGHSYRDGHSQHANRDPQRDLRVAVLETAISDVQLREVSGRADEIRTNARHWFDGGWSEWPYSFLHLCAALGLPPGAVKRRALQDAPPPCIRPTGRAASATELPMYRRAADVIAKSGTAVGPAAIMLALGIPRYQAQGALAGCVEHKLARRVRAGLYVAVRQEPEEGGPCQAA